MNFAPTGVIVSALESDALRDVASWELVWNDAGSKNPRATPLARSPQIWTAPLFSTNPQWGTPRSRTDLRSNVGEREAPPLLFRIDILSGFNSVSSEHNREVNAPPPSAASVIEGSDEDKVLSQYQHLKEEWEDTRNNEAKNPWKTCLDHLVKRDKTKCNAWDEDVDTILIFVGLFSAVGTAFTIDSYKWLEADPGNTTNMILQHLSGQLAGTQRLEYVPAPFTITSSVRRINRKED
ncbi:hypothetical protein CPB85DRAFT_1438755 [Mucidula mucida]|nr:hypothetical protein CPB85DRAFT_1438755 [Mucidula mucida]